MFLPSKKQGVLFVLTAVLTTYLATAILTDSVIAILVNIIITVGVIVGYIYLSIKLSRELFRPKDSLTPLRWRIFTVVFLIVLTLIPSLVYQILRLLGVESEEVRNIVTVTSRVNSLGALLVLFSTLTYNRKEK